MTIVNETEPTVKVEAKRLDLRDLEQCIYDLESMCVVRQVLPGDQAKLAALVSHIRALEAEVDELRSSDDGILTELLNRERENTAEVVAEAFTLQQRVTELEQERTALRDECDRQGVTV